MEFKFRNYGLCLFGFFLLEVAGNLPRSLTTAGGVICFIAFIVAGTAVFLLSMRLHAKDYARKILAEVNADLEGAGHRFIFIGEGK